MNRISLTLATLLFASVWMQGEDEPKPIPSGKPLEPTVIEAERMRSEKQGDTTYLIFSGSVKLTATNLLITCNQLEVFANTKENEEKETSLGDISSIQKIIATGNVRIVQEERTATAGRMEVLPNEDVILLDENPMVFQDAITIDGTGAQLTIHRGSGRIEMTGDSANKIRIIVPPIQDFGYEDDGKTIIPDEQKVTPNDDGQTEAAENTEDKPTESEDKPSPTPKKGET